MVRSERCGTVNHTTGGSQDTAPHPTPGLSEPAQIKLDVYTYMHTHMHTHAHLLALLTWPPFSSLSWMTQSAAADGGRGRGGGGSGEEGVCTDNHQLSVLVNTLLSDAKQAQQLLNIVVSLYTHPPSLSTSQLIDHGLNQFTRADPLHRQWTQGHAPLHHQQPRTAVWTTVGWTRHIPEAYGRDRDWM